MLGRSRLGLIAAACLAAAPAPAAPRAVQVGEFVWHGSGEHFGGFSGLELTEDGLGFVALSDSGALMYGRLQRDPSGAVIGVAEAAFAHLHSAEGDEYDKYSGDSEGLALAPDGSILVSFERDHRIERFRLPEAVALPVPGAPEFAELGRNAGIEALAIAADGALIAIPERSGAVDRPFPVYSNAGGEWHVAGQIRRDGLWLPVGADIGPDGQLYLLERDFIPLVGFMSRVRRITLVGEGVAADHILLVTQAGQHDNLEGLAAWRDAAGAIRLTMISDDNFLPLQVSQFVDYRVEE